MRWCCACWMEGQKWNAILLRVLLLCYLQDKRLEKLQKCITICALLFRHFFFLMVLVAVDWWNDSTKKKCDRKKKPLQKCIKSTSHTRTMTREIEWNPCRRLVIQYFGWSSKNGILKQMEKLKTTENYTLRVYIAQAENKKIISHTPTMAQLSFIGIFLFLSTNYSGGGRVSCYARELIENRSCTCEVFSFSSFCDSNSWNCTHTHTKVQTFFIFSLVLQLEMFLISMQHISLFSISPDKKLSCGRDKNAGGSFLFHFLLFSYLLVWHLHVVANITQQQISVEKRNAINHCQNCQNCQKFVYKCEISIFMRQFQWYEKWCANHFDRIFFFFFFK